MISVYFVSNFLSLHQQEVCKAFLRQTDVEFTFVSCFGPSGFKKNISNSEHLDYVIRMYDGSSNFAAVKEKINKADLVIFGSGDMNLIRERKTIVFRYSEHFSKKPALFLLKAIHIHFLYKKEDRNGGFLLCSSSHTKKDFNFAGLYRNKCLYYGYFPPTESNYNLSEKRYLKDGKTHLLWLGRGLKWKHPEVAFKIAKFLYKKGFDFSMKICSTKTKTIDSLVKKNKNKDFFKNVVFVPPTDHDEALNLMAESDVFLFSSDRGEGWGAVLNEAMYSKCVCFANKSAGATKFLVKDGVNGYDYKNLSVLKRKLLFLLNNKKLFEVIGEKANKTISQTWNADRAVKNLIAVYKSIVSGERINGDLINNGPGTFIEE